jgi:hypothetical protein
LRPVLALEARKARTPLEEVGEGSVEIDARLLLPRSLRPMKQEAERREPLEAPRFIGGEQSPCRLP